MTKKKLNDYPVWINKYVSEYGGGFSQRMPDFKNDFWGQIDKAGLEKKVEELCFEEHEIKMSLLNGVKRDLYEYCVDKACLLNPISLTDERNDINKVMRRASELQKGIYSLHPSTKFNFAMIATYESDTDSFLSDFDMLLSALIKYLERLSTERKMEAHRPRKDAERDLIKNLIITFRKNAELLDIELFFPDEHEENYFGMSEDNMLDYARKRKLEFMGESIPKFVQAVFESFGIGFSKNLLCEVLKNSDIKKTY